MSLLLFVALVQATRVLADTGETADTADSGDVGPCMELAVVPDACVAGEFVSVEVIDCGDGDWRDEDVTFQFSTDERREAFREVGIGDDGVYRADFLCPEVECPGASANVYANVFDEDGNQNWASTRVAVTCAPVDGDRDADTGGLGACGCAATPTGGGVFGVPWLLVVGLAAWGRRRLGE